VTRNFYEESMNILEPRVDFRGAGSGIVGMEFPLVLWLVAAVERTIGPHAATARAVVLLLSLVAVVGCYALTRRLTGSPALGLVGALLLVVSPLFAYYSVTLLPDAPMLGPLTLGLAGLVAWSRTPRIREACLGVSGLTLAALLKLSSASSWLLAAVLLLSGFAKAGAWKRIAVLVLTVAGALAIAAWYLHARELAREGVGVFKLDLSFPYPAAVVPRVAHKVLVQWLPELFLNYAAFALFLWGIAAKPPGMSRALLVAWAAGGLAYVVAFLPMFEMHDYYAIALLPLFVFLATSGFASMRAGHAGVRTAAAILLGGAIVLGPLRGLSRLEGVHPASDLATLEPFLDQVIPDRHALVIAANDPSPNIYLYFMHRKGWSAMSTMSVRELESRMILGARYLVSDSRDLENRPEIAERLHELGRHGRFRVFQLQGSRW
jgi:hypothetical protein